MTREEAIYVLNELLEKVKASQNKTNILAKEKQALEFAIEAFKERPHGEWLSHYEYCKKHDCIPSGLIAFWWCNQCEQGVEIATNFCPECGASMWKEGGEK